MAADNEARRAMADQHRRSSVDCACTVGSRYLRTVHVVLPLLHYGRGVTDCGREVAELPPTEGVASRPELVTCGECCEAGHHLGAGSRTMLWMFGTPRPPHRGEDD